MDKDKLQIQAMINSLENPGSLSDGYHSFDELYFHRMMLFSIICNKFKGYAWKSWRHSDGTMYDDMFVVGITTPKGDYSYHYESEYWDRFNVTEFEKAPVWDGHKPEDIDRLYSLLDMTPSGDAWAMHEISILTKNSDSYMKACCNSAMKAYMSLRDDEHSGMSIGLTKTILNRLINGVPLTELTGDESEWSELTDSNDSVNYVEYVNNRCSSVYKKVYADGTVTYSWLDRYIFKDIHSSTTWHTGAFNNYLNKIFGEITFPFYPSNSITVYVEEFLKDPNNGDFDHEALLYAMDGNKRVNLYKYHKEENGKWVDQDRDSYLMDREQAIKANWL